MGAPYRQPSSSPHHERIVELLRRSGLLLASFDESAKATARNNTAALVLLLAGDVRHRSSEDDALEATLDQAHAAFWQAINEARELLARAGYDVGGARDAQGRPKPLWSSRQALDTAAAVQAQLEALLPNVDFTVAKDDEADAFLASQRRSKRRFWIGLSLLVFVAPFVALALVLLLG